MPFVAVPLKIGPQRIVLAAEERGIRPGPRHFADALRAEAERQGDVARNRGRARCGARDSTYSTTEPKYGQCSRIVRRQLHRHVDRRHAGQGVGHAVDRIGMRQRAEHRRAVHHLRHVRQQLADLAARQRRRNHSQLAANLDRGVRLAIDPLQLARRAVEVNQDQALGLAEVRHPCVSWAPTVPAAARPAPATARPARARRRGACPGGSCRCKAALAEPRMRSMSTD